MTNNTFSVTPGALDLYGLEDFARRPLQVVIDPGCRSAVEKASAVVTGAAAGEDAVYGINTGFGKLANTRIAPKDTAQLQRNLILSHCCGMGEPLADAIVRMVMLLKLCSLAQGASGVRWSLIECLSAMLNAGILPVIPSQGSVGASGDLAPLAHMTAAMMGVGSVRVNGVAMDADKALAHAAIEPFQLGPKEGLAMINGTQVSTGIALVAFFEAWRNCQSALVSGALSCDALMASTVPFRPEIHLLRRQQGQRDAATALRSLLDGSQIRESHREDDERVQDPYCFRCQPQVVGACIDQLRHVGRVLENEANAVTDNPLVVAETGEILSGGNFHAEPVAFAADICALVIAEIGSITERRIATLVDPALNYGLPAFLSPRPGLNSGYMIAEVTAAALMSENKFLASPCCIDSTPTSANQEDHVSMACHAACRLIGMNRNLSRIIGIELLTACQGVEFRLPLQTGALLNPVIAGVREHIDALGDDRYLADDLARAATMVTDGEVISTIPRELLPDFSGDEDLQGH